MRFLTITLLLCLAIATLSCGSSGNSSASAGSPLSGNWQVTLIRHSSTDTFTFSGFLLQSGGTVSGSFVLVSGPAASCLGVGPVTGTYDGQNLQLTVGEFGQDFSLSSSLPSASASNGSISGQFSTLAGGCIGFASTGTWTAVRVLPLTGPFQGSFILGSGSSSASVGVTGTMTQGPNVGASNATLSGALNQTGSSFCSYLSDVTIAGLVSGSTANLNLYGPDGSQIGQVSNATVALDGTSLTSTGGVLIDQISSTCSPQTGSVTLNFP